MSTYVIKIEGQDIPVPEEIGASDENVKKALAPFWPDAANAMITRTEKDDTVTVNVVKRAGTKGADPLAYLQDCPGGKNPAIALYEELQQSLQGSPDVEALLALDERIGKAIEAGQEQAEAVRAAGRRLLEALPQPAPAVVLGF